MVHGTRAFTARLLRPRTWVLQTRGGSGDCIPMRRATNRTATGITCRHHRRGLKTLENNESVAGSAASKRHLRGGSQARSGKYS